HTRSKRDWSSDVCSSDLTTRTDDHATQRLTSRLERHTTRSSGFAILRRIICSTHSTSSTNSHAPTKPPSNTTTAPEPTQICLRTLTNFKKRFMEQPQAAEDQEEKTGHQSAQKP